MPGDHDQRLACPALIPMNDLLTYREEGLALYLCTRCRTRHDVSALLTGFAPPSAASEAALDLLTTVADGIGRLESQAEDIISSVNRLEDQAADITDSIRQVLRAVSAEVTDCPLLFTLTLASQQGLRRLRVGQQHYRLVLWCEHPGHWHPWAAATYSIDQPREWLVRISPYASIVLALLKSAVPVAAAAAGMVLTPDQLNHATSELKLMTTLASELPALKAGASPGDLPEQAAGPMAPAQGQAMRAIRTVIFQHDAQKAFGDMRRVLTAAGDYLWICPDHYGSYDPGLPSIPGS